MSKHDSTELNMSVQEIHSWLLSKASPHNTAFKVGLNVRLDIERLHDALHVVIKQQPRLHYCFCASEPTFSSLNNKHFDIKIINKNNWCQLAESELLRSFVDGEALYHIYILDAELPG